MKRLQELMRHCGEYWLQLVLKTPSVAKCHLVINMPVKTLPVQHVKFLICGWLHWVVHLTPHLWHFMEGFVVIGRKFRTPVWAVQHAGCCSESWPYGTCAWVEQESCGNPGYVKLLRGWNRLPHFLLWQLVSKPSMLEAPHAIFATFS